jgi:hypothetical protein
MTNLAMGREHSNCVVITSIRLPDGWEIDHRMRRMRRMSEDTINTGLAPLGMLKRAVVPHL